MNNMKKRDLGHKRRCLRMKDKLVGTAERPRLRVSRSHKNISAQLIDDASGKTLTAVSSLSKDFGDQYGGNVAAAEKVGEMIAKLAVERSIQKVVFDRGGRMYHGRIKALAEAARKGGLQF